MSYIEKDPRDTGYAALYLAIKWYRLIEPEAALRIAKGASSAKPGRKLTPQIREQINKIIDSTNFKNFNSIEKKYKINRYDIITSEEAFDLGQIELLVKRLKNTAEGCSGECDKCYLNTQVTDNLTMCEYLCDIDLKNPQKVGNRLVQQSAIKCNLEGATIKKGFEVYETVLGEFKEYIDSNPGKKVKDIVSAALLEYIERHKKE